MSSHRTNPRMVRRDAIARPSCRLVGCLFLLVVAVWQTGCAGPAVHQRTVAFVDPPRERLRASLANDRIKVSDVLEFKLADGSTATLGGTYQVGPDGAIEVSGHGKIQVAGKTIEEARQAVREALALKSAVEALVDLDRSEYYLVTVTADGVQDLTRVPLKDRVTVKDAVRGIPRPSSKVMWIVRPTPEGTFREQILGIDWEAIARGEDLTTNYALKAHDWLIVAEEPAKGFGRVFGALTGMFSDGKAEQPGRTPPRASDKPAPPPMHFDQLADPKAERI